MFEYDDVMSPCIDAGDPASDYSNEPAYNGGRINMGRYGNTSTASLMYFYLKNSRNNKYANVEAQTGKVEYSDTIPGLSARWSIIPAGENGVYRVRNYWKGWWLNNDQGQDYLECKCYNGGGDNNTKWYVEYSGNYVKFRNYIRDTRYIHIENNLLGYIQCTPLGDPGWLSAQWILEHP